MMMHGRRQLLNWWVLIYFGDVGSIQILDSLVSYNNYTSFISYNYLHYVPFPRNHYTKFWKGPCLWPKKALGLDSLKDSDLWKFNIACDLDCCSSQSSSCKHTSGGVGLQSNKVVRRGSNPCLNSIRCWWCGLVNLLDQCYWFIRNCGVNEWGIL